MRVSLALVAAIGVLTATGAGARSNEDPIVGTWFYGRSTILISLAKQTSAGSFVFEARARSTIALGGCSFAPGELVFQVVVFSGSAQHHSVVPEGSCLGNVSGRTFAIETFSGYPSFWFCPRASSCYRFLKQRAAPTTTSTTSTTTGTTSTTETRDVRGVYEARIEYHVRVHPWKQAGRTYRVHASWRFRFGVNSGGYVSSSKDVGLLSTFVNLSSGALRGTFAFKGFTCSWDNRSTVRHATFQCKDQRRGVNINSVTGTLTARKT